MFLSKFILELIVKKTSLFHLLCVLDHFHTHHASNVFQYLILYLYKFIEKSDFHIEVGFLKIPVLVYALISKSQK